MSTGPPRRQFGPRHEDLERNLVWAVATGSVAFVAQDLLQQLVSEEERLKTCKKQTVWATDGRVGVELQVPAQGQSWSKGLERVLQQFIRVLEAGAVAARRCVTLHF